MSASKVGSHVTVDALDVTSSLGARAQTRVPSPKPQPAEGQRVSPACVGGEGSIPSPQGQSEMHNAGRVGLRAFGKRQDHPGVKATGSDELTDGFKIVAKGPIKKEDYLASGEQVQVSFHTQVKSDGNDKFRNLELQKKGEDGERVPDTDRQEKVTQKFCELKEKLHLGKTPISYSVTHHLLEVYRDGTIESYDLFSEVDVQRLLIANEAPPSTDPKEVIKELDGIRKTLQTKEYLGVEVTKFPTLMQDCMGSVDGPNAFAITTQGLLNADKDEQSHLFYKTMEKRGLVKKSPEQSRLRSTKYTLTTEGKKAVEEMRRVRLLQHMIIERYDAVIHLLDREIGALERVDPPISVGREGLSQMKEKRADLQRVRDEIASANLFAMDHIIMDLHGNIPFSRPVVDAEGRPQMRTNDFGMSVGQLQPSSKEKGATLMQPVEPNVEGIPKDDQRWRDEKQLDYVERLADQITGDIERSVAQANRSPWRHLPFIGGRFDKPYKSVKEERMTYAATGAQVFDLLEGDGPQLLDPIRRRKIAFMQKHGIRQMPQAHRGMDLLLHAARQSDDSPVNMRKFKGESTQVGGILVGVLQDFKAARVHDSVGTDLRKAAEQLGHLSHLRPEPRGNTREEIAKNAQKDKAEVLSKLSETDQSIISDLESRVRTAPIPNLSTSNQEQERRQLQSSTQVDPQESESRRSQTPITPPEDDPLATFNTSVGLDIDPEFDIRDRSVDQVQPLNKPKKRVRFQLTPEQEARELRKPHIEPKPPEENDPAVPAPLSQQVVQPFKHKDSRPVPNPRPNPSTDLDPIE